MGIFILSTVYKRGVIIIASHLTQLLLIFSIFMSHMTSKHKQYTHNLSKYCKLYYICTNSH